MKNSSAASSLGAEKEAAGKVIMAAVPSYPDNFLQERDSLSQWTVREIKPLEKKKNQGQLKEMYPAGKTRKPAGGERGNTKKAKAKKAIE